MENPSKRMLPGWPVAAGVAVLLIAGFAVWWLSQSPTSGPIYVGHGIKAQLPFPQYKTVSVSSDEMIGDRLDSDPANYIFSVERGGGPRDLAYIQSFMTSFSQTSAFDEPKSLDFAKLGEYQAVRFECLWHRTAGPDMRTVFYAFPTKNFMYIVAGGAVPDEWDNGGRQAVEAMLNSVQVTEP